ncbi:SRPBCC domain-containing protein [Streptacidiphilus monticola]
MTERSTTHATFTIERSFDAPIARVFDAWADAKAKSRWFAGATDASEREAMEVDFRVGGVERSVGTLLDGGPVYTYEGVFQDIVRNERIVLTHHISRDGERISVNLVSIQFAPDGDGTRLTVTDQGTYLDGLDQAHWRKPAPAANSTCYNGI